jgi:hypothetical protein
MANNNNIIKVEVHWDVNYIIRNFILYFKLYNEFYNFNIQKLETLYYILNMRWQWQWQWLISKN